MKRKSTEVLHTHSRRGPGMSALLVILCTMFSFAGTNMNAQSFDPCPSLDVIPRYTGPDCCWEFVLRNGQAPQAFSSVKATVLTPAASITSASGGFSINTTASNVTWLYPNYIPSGDTKVGGCFNSPSGVIKLLFEWRFQGTVVCRDTVVIDCPSGQTDDTCSTDSLRISTGWDPYNEALHSTGNYTTFWQVVGDPSPSTTEPRPASVIPKHAGWDGPLGTSQWISSYPSASNDTNGTYIFQTCFCVKEDARNVRLIFDILADDRARVYLNGTQVGATPASWGFKDPANHIDTNITQLIKPGRNCIRVEVDNTNNVAMGLNIDGYITADGIGLERSACCDPGGILTGMKFEDLNCNGKKEAGEPGLPGWTIQLSNGATTTTDALGNYYFNNLAPGVYTVSEINQPGWTQTYPSAPGTYTVTLTTGQAIGALDFGNCRQQEPEECFEIRPDTIYCKQEPGTASTMYTYQFNARSMMPCQFSQTASINVLSPAGISVSPSGFPISNTWSSQTIALSGPGAIPGTAVSLQVKVCCVTVNPKDNTTDTIDCCYDTIRVVLPECGPVDECPDCCEKFPKKFDRLFQWSSANGSTSVGGALQAGAAPICTVSATIVEARINGQPVAGQFVPTSNLSGSPGTISYMHEVYWTGIDVSAGPTPFDLNLQFPAMAFNAFTDQINYCIRFRYTDRNCRSCDTVICFSQRRYKWIFPWLDQLDHGKTSGKEQKIQNSSAPGLSGVLTGEESGRLDVTFPIPPSEIGEIRYVGLEIDPAEEFIEIKSGTSDDYTFVSRGFGVVSEPFSAEPGTSTSVNLTYLGLYNRSQLDHWITLRFVRTASPSDTLEETGIIRFYRGDFEGGDKLEQDAHVDEAKTFALYLHNNNGSEEPISRLVIGTEAGTDILAIGPGPSPQQAVVSFSQDAGNADDAAGIDLTGAESELGPDGTLGPVYVTLTGFSGTTELTFATLNKRGTIITQGSLTLSETPSGIHTGETVQSIGGVELHGAYPNPTDGGTTVRFRMNRASSNTDLTIVDASGSEVQRLLDGEAVATGEHALWFETGTLPTGTYFVTLSADGQSETSRLQIVR